MTLMKIHITPNSQPLHQIRKRTWGSAGESNKRQKLEIIDNENPEDGDKHKLDKSMSNLSVSMTKAQEPQPTVVIPYKGKIYIHVTLFNFLRNSNQKKTKLCHLNKTQRRV